METRIHASELRPVVAEAKKIGDFCRLDFKQGDNTMMICLPERMAAVAHMIAEAFNAHWNDRRADGVAASPDWDDLRAKIGLPTGSALRTADAIHLATHLAALTDEDAARAVEMRDLP